MAEVSYTLPLIAADLALFDFASAADLTLRKLAARFRAKMGQVHPDRPGGGDIERAKALAAARDRLQRWEKAGRPIAAEPVKPKPDGPYSGYADTAAAAAAREKERRERAKAAEAAEEARLRKEMDDLKAEIAATKRYLFWARFRAVAFAPFRLLLWGFAHLPTEVTPWVVTGLVVVFGYPFLQDSSYGQYVPRLPSIYQWFRNTDFWYQLHHPHGPWYNR